MLDLALFRDRAFAAGNILLVLAGFGLFGVFFFLSLYLQGIVGLSAVQGGLAFTPMAAVLIVAAPASARLAERFGAGRIVSSGMLLLGAVSSSSRASTPGRTTSTSCPACSSPHSARR
jgi:predicted MFS family arabinose efflux permease